MELSISLLVATITYIVAELLKGFTISKRIIPFINFGVGVLSAIIVIIFKIGDFSTLENIVFCLLASMGAGGIYDITNVIVKRKEN